MYFNPDSTKQAVEVLFSRKQLHVTLPKLTFNNSTISSEESTKHLGLILDKRLSFDHHLKEKISIANKGVGLIIRLRKYQNASVCIQNLCATSSGLQ